MSIKIYMVVIQTVKLWEIFLFILIYFEYCIYTSQFAIFFIMNIYFLYITGYVYVYVYICIHTHTFRYVNDMCTYIYIYIISQTKVFLLWWTFTAHIYIFRKRSISAFLPLSLFENTWPLAHNNWEFLFPCPTSALPINLMSTIFQIYPETTFTITTVGQEMTVSCLDDFFLP